MATQGKLRVELVEAKLTRDTETFGKMDPYCRLKYREQLFKSKVMQNAGKTPRWNQVSFLDFQQTHQTYICSLDIRLRYKIHW